MPAELVTSRSVQVRAVPLPVAAGEAILLHNHLWHRSGRSMREMRRMAFSACYMSAKVRCVRRRRAPRTFFEVFPAAAGHASK